MENDIVVNFIIRGLACDDKFHNLKERSGGEFYIDILTEILTDEIGAKGSLEKKGGNNEELLRELSKISWPYVERTKKKLKELEKEKWVKIAKIKIEILEVGREKSIEVDQDVVPEGDSLALKIKVTTREINWSKIIEYVAREYEKTKLDRDNLFGIDKQESIIIEKLWSKSKYLGKDTDIIFLLDVFNTEVGRVQFLETLKSLEQKNLVNIEGFEVYDPETPLDKIIKKITVMSHSSIPPKAIFALKAKLSLTQEFKEKMEAIDDEKSAHLAAGAKRSAPNKEGSKLSVVIDFQNGIYKASRPDKVYEISGKRKKIVEYLCGNPVASLSDLTAAMGQQDSLMVKEISEINKNFKNLLVVKGDLIVNSKTAGGYSLNEREFTIKKPETSA